MTKNFANKTFHPVTRHRACGISAPDGHAETRSGFTRRRDQREVPAANPPPGGESMIEIRLPEQSRPTRKPLRRRVGRDYGASRARPFLRRAASTRRPALDAMRARNPWVRLRCSRLGW